jgi:hypothetical protein
MAEKSDKNVMRTVFELLVLFLALAVIFGGLALVIFFSPWGSNGP